MVNREQAAGQAQIDALGQTQARASTDQSGHEQQDDGQGPQADIGGQNEGSDQGDDHTGDAVGDALARAFVPGQTGQAQNKQDGGDDVGRLCGGFSSHRGSAFQEHAEHAAGHGESAENVDSGHDDGDERQDGDGYMIHADLQ